MIQIQLRYKEHHLSAGIVRPASLTSFNPFNTSARSLSLSQFVAISIFR